MALAFTELEGALKTSNNPHFKSKYADLGNVIDAIKPALAKQGLFFWQVSHDTPDGAMIETVIGHKSGGERSLGKLFIPASKRDAHGFGSALTYARRYALMAAFGIPAEDDDGNAAARSTRDEGQSQRGAVSPHPDPAPKRGLDGPSTSKASLRQAFGQVQREVIGCGDDDQLSAYLATDEAKAIIAQCERDAPSYLHGGDPAPPEFEPLYARIQRMRDEWQMEKAA
jgi:hypothetical protein